MSSDDIAIRVRDVSKHYVLFERPEDRLKQMVIPRLERMAGRAPRRYYRDFAALTDVSFEVKRGETVGIIGRNGSGKSTLLQIICGTLQPTRGKVEVNGRIAALLELGAGFNPDFTGRENVYLNAAILGLSRSEIERRFDDIARFADIGVFLDQPVKTYSSGMYVRLAFATAINVDPDILVVDEALAVGDEAFQRKCFARIEEIKERGGTILFVSHGAQTIMQLCTRAMLFDSGDLLLEGRPKTVVAQYQRLTNASAAASPEIRKSIVAMRDLPRPDRASIAFFHTGAPPPGRNGQEVGEVSTLGAHTDYFDPILKPQSTVLLEERGAHIRDVHILTLSGEQVNVLQMGRRYVLEYYVDFSTDAEGVGFGMFVRTVEGIHLAGAQTRNSSLTRCKNIANGTTATVRYEFTCLFLPGVYFIGCGVQGATIDGLHILARAHDIAVFRVSAESELIATDFIDIGPSPNVQLYAPT